MKLLETEWRDFVTFPLDPDRIRTREQRFDLSLQSEGAFIVRRDLLDFLVEAGDEFEAMRVDALGNVEFWTRKTVWTLLRRHGLEKLLFLWRHPYDADVHD